MNTYDMPRPHLSNAFAFTHHSLPPTDTARPSIAHGHTASVAQALDSRRIAAPAPGLHFDPATSKATFRIALCSQAEFALLPALLQRLRLEAPESTLTLLGLDTHSGSAADATIGLALKSDNQTRHERLRAVRPMVLRADTQHGPLTLQDFCNRPHISLSRGGDLDRHVDQSLQQLGRKRQTALSISQPHLLPGLLARSDMLAVVTDYVADILVMQGGVRAEPLPLPMDDNALELSMAWHQDADGIASQRWLRARVRMFLGEQ